MPKQNKKTEEACILLAKVISARSHSLFKFLFCFFSYKTPKVMLILCPLCLSRIKHSKIEEIEERTKMITNYEWPKLLQQTFTLHTSEM